MAEEYLTYAEAADYLGVSKDQIGPLVRGAGLQWSPHQADQRKKLRRRADVERLKVKLDRSHQPAGATP